MRQFLFTSMLLIALLVSSGCDRATVSEPIRLAGSTMGTSYSVIVYAPASEKLRIEIGVQRQLARVVDSMSTYEPRSDISLFNEAAVNTWVPVSSDVVTVVSAALNIAERSNGAFDPTILPLVNIWGFGPLDRPEEVPTEVELSAALAMLGWEAIETRAEPPALRKTAPREIDLSAIAKGYGADVVADYLLSLGYNEFLVELGGDMRISGAKPDGSPWRVGIETPEEGIARSAYRVLEFNGDAALVTSGDYRNYFEVDGVRYSHTIDPSTGYPVTHNMVSVSVLAENAMLADAWATALVSVGPEQARTLADTYDLSIYLIERASDQFVEYTTGEFTRLMNAGE
ncbi:MAG: FAD:protein FMN transferase [Natronospirillum sp.]